MFLLKKRFFIPSVITNSVSAVCLIFYTIAYPEKDILVYIQGIFNAILPLFFLIFRNFFKKDIPIIIDFSAALYIVLANSFGTTLSFYRNFPLWDLFMHGIFGLVAAVILYALYSDKFSLLNFLSVMGLSALWECFEYLSDILLSGDTQMVKVSLSEGRNPIEDTMTDILITIVGYIVFVLVLYIYKKIKRREI